MKFVKYNPNPLELDTGDCVVRAISKAAGLSWDDAYDAVAVQGKEMCMMPSTDEVWGAWLLENGFERHPLPDRCPDCYTVVDSIYNRLSTCPVGTTPVYGNQAIFTCPQTAGPYRYNTCGCGSCA